MSIIGITVNKVLNVFGRELRKVKKRRKGVPTFYDEYDMGLGYDLETEANEGIKIVRKNTMMPYVNLLTLYEQAVYCENNNIEGDFVECGVWKGGSTMAAALSLMDEGQTNRKLYLYDTFDGMSEPTEADRSYQGVSAATILESSAAGEEFWCRSPIEEVKANLDSTGYPSDKVHYIKGKVEETIPGSLPGKISVLRLDTDWYESTKHELTHLFPLLVEGGFLIIDDYGFWEGARKAVDEFFEASSKKYFLHRIDSTGRLIIK